MLRSSWEKQRLSTPFWEFLILAASNTLNISGSFLNFLLPFGSFHLVVSRIRGVEWLATTFYSLLGVSSSSTSMYIALRDSESFYSLLGVSSSILTITGVNGFVTFTFYSLLGVSS